MLKTTVLSDNLRSSLSFVSHAVSSRSQLPILLNFLLVAKDGSLIISATDLEIGMIVKVPAKVEEEGAITVPAKTFSDLINSIEQEKIELSVKDTTLELKGDRLKTTFPTLAASEFPKLFEEKGEKQAEFSRKGFEEEISRIVFAAALDSGRPALSGVLIRNEDSGLVVVATDGFRLSLKKGFLENKGKSTNLSFLIPARVIRELLSIKTDQKIELYTSKKSNQVLFDCGDTTLIGRLIEAEYPNYQKIIPGESSTGATFDRIAAQNAVRACSVFAREAANIIKMGISKDKVVFSASASSVGENEIEIEAKTTGEENEIAFNSRYLLDFFSNVEDETVSFEMTGPLNPGVFKLPEEKGYLHLIMPIRIQG